MQLTSNTAKIYFSLGVMIMHVVDEDAYSFPDFISTILPTATPVDLPACSTVPYGINSQHQQVLDE